MERTIIADSSCDMTPQLRERLNVVSVPLTLRLGQKEYLDDENLDLVAFMAEMKACTEPVGSAAPSSGLYKQAMLDAQDSFVITLSSQLSGSYESAVIGESLARKERDIETHIFDSKSATAGEVLIAVKLRELIDSGLERGQIIETINNFISTMKTYFVLDRYDNLLKNGRLPKIQGKLISVLNIKLVMGADEKGTIALFDKVRGAKQIIKTMVSYIEKSGKKTEGETLVITHCFNPVLAQQLVDAVKEKHTFKEILVVQTNGLSSLYTDDKGIVMAF